MRRTLSSLQTIPLKIFSPIVWIFALGLALNRFLGVFQSEDQAGKWIFLGFLVLYSLQTWECMRLKTIDVDDHNLYIGNFTKEISVPLSEILNVTPKRWPRWQVVTIHLKSSSEFGNKIEFIPKARFFAFGQHPVVRELKALAKKASTVEPVELA
jgi:hypothetical protein